MGDVDFAPLLSRAVAAESDQQVDIESDDEPIEDPDQFLDQIDTEWPPDPLNQVDEEWPPVNPMNEVDDLSPNRQRRRPRPIIFEDVVRAGKQHAGARAHFRSRNRRRRKIATEGHTPSASVCQTIFSEAEPISVANFDASTLPTAQGAYGGKTELPDETRGKTRKRSVAELIGLGFQLIKWDGRTPHPLADRMGRIFAVLAGQPGDASYRDSVNSA
ncbi:hypothetical protein C8R45DRAFT_1186839 [Mycena sanguinolenta]|nr:hypothetical protein C8R45DRAFT_1186839 [Mycena sanguinolenta]